MKFNRSKTQILYRYFPGALFEHDKFGICLVTDVSITAGDKINEDSVKNALSNYLKHWVSYGEDAFPDPFTDWGDYKIGVPDRVAFEPFPPIVECSKCGHINSLSDLAEMPIGKSTNCTMCNEGRYRQLVYVTIHNCGSLEPIPVPLCPKHGKSTMTFEDTGRFTTAFWRCSTCGYTRGMPRYQCTCAFSRQLRLPDQANQKNIQYVRTNDTSVSYSHTLPIINLTQSSLSKLKQDKRSPELLLARLWGLIDKNIFGVIKDRTEVASQPAMNSQVQDAIRRLLDENPTKAEYQMLLSMAEKPASLPEDDKLDIVRQYLPEIVETEPTTSLLEHIAILDSLDVMGPTDAIENAKNRNDEAGAFDFEQGWNFACETLGFKSLACITDFPMALISLGYSRGSKTPGETFLKPFRTSRDGSKIPIYTVTSNTEAIMIQLNPIRVVDWLFKNSLATGTQPFSEIDCWAWCSRNLHSYRQFRGIANAPDTLTTSEKAVIALMHSISHLLMKQIEWSGFDPENVGEYLLPETLGIIIHSINYNSFTIGGLVTMFEQRLHGWLRDTFNAAFNCAYNPICEDEGGSCAGCLHRQYNCEGFNELLSRSVLEGGWVPDIKQTVNFGYWTMGQ